MLGSFGRPSVLVSSEHQTWSLWPNAWTKCRLNVLRGVGQTLQESDTSFARLHKRIGICYCLKASHMNVGFTFCLSTIYCYSNDLWSRASLWSCWLKGSAYEYKASLYALLARSLLHAHMPSTSPLQPLMLSIKNSHGQHMLAFPIIWPTVKKA